MKGILFIINYYNYDISVRISNNHFFLLFTEVIDDKKCHKTYVFLSIICLFLRKKIDSKVCEIIISVKFFALQMSMLFVINY